VPARDRQIFHEWSDTILGDISRDPASIETAFADLSSYFAGLIATKRAEPQDDLMTALIEARDAQDRLTEEELVRLGLTLLIAGHETTANQINLFLLALHEFPEELDRLLGDWQHDPEDMERALDDIKDYFHTLIADKRAHPTDDLMTALIAGHETTANQINLFLLALLRHPDELARLRAEPRLIPQAVEELMRFVQLGTVGAGLTRVTTEEVELSGVRIPAGAAVIPAMAVANRDPEAAADPDRLDLTREQFTHLGFGAGVHHCLGAQLARMELQEALRGLLARMPRLTIDVPVDQLSFKEGIVVRSVCALPVRW